MAETGTDVIHCRLSPDLMERVDEFIVRLRAKGVSGSLATRSGVVRVLLAEKLSEDPSGAITAEIMARLPYFLQQVSSRALEKTLERLPAIADEISQQITAEIFGERVSTPQKRRKG